MQQAIDLREKALESHGDLRSAAMKDVLARVPQLAADFQAAEAKKANSAERMRDDYRAKWEAFISWAVKEFDRRVGETMAAGEKVMVTTKVDDYRTAGIGRDGGSSPIIRAVTFNGVELRLYCASAQVQPERLSAGGGLTITVRDLTNRITTATLSLTFDLDRASVGKLTGSSQYDALMGSVVAGINQGIQDLLVVGRAHVR